MADDEEAKHAAPTTWYGKIWAFIMFVLLPFLHFPSLPPLTVPYLPQVKASDAPLSATLCLFPLY